MEARKNKFFRDSVKKAAEILKSRRRLTALLSAAVAKLSHVNLGNINKSKFVEQIKVFGRMTKAYATGSYRGIPRKSILIVIGALVYFVTPIDLVPDFIPVTGLLDDFTVIVWVYNTLQGEIEEFMQWEILNNSEKRKKII